MRTRLIVPAVLIATAAYMKGRRDGRLAGRLSPPEPAFTPSPLADPDGMARALAADAVELAEAQTAAAAGAMLAPAGARPAEDPDGDWEDPFAVSEAVLASEWVAAPSPARTAGAATPAPAAPAEVELRVDETGRFSLGGYATQAGHIALAGITFRERRSGLVTPEAVSLVTEAASNVADGGLVVLGDPGFAPDEEGFTLLLAAEGPGTFAAAGYYELAPR